MRSVVVIWVAPAFENGLGVVGRRRYEDVASIYKQEALVCSDV